MNRLRLIPITVALAIGGCYAPPVQMLPADAPGGIRLSMPGVYCAFNNHDDAPGEFDAQLVVENPTGHVLRMDTDRIAFVAGGNSERPWKIRKIFSVGPHERRTLPIRVYSYYLRCDQEVTMLFDSSLALDGVPVVAGPLKVVPSASRTL